jgi:2-C-methyl-D-erythritol 4-phosphate cytidylyltransferase
MEKFISREDVTQVIVVVSPSDIDWFRKYYLSEINRLLLLVVAGGAERVDSIRNGLLAVSPRVDYVAVHDAVRPCVTAQEIADVFAAAKKHGAALLASPLVGTIKKVVDGQVTATVPREHLCEAQPPQVFRRDWILEAYQQKIKDAPTDDVQLVERLGKPVHVVPTDSGNIKITTQSDLVLAKHLVEQGR